MSFTDDIMKLRYSWDKPDGTKESWDDICERVVDNVFSVVTEVKQGDYNKEWDKIMLELKNAMKQRKFIAGGRFLAQAGRDYHQTNNCFLLRVEDTREGWGELLNKVTTMLMSGGGIGIDYSDLRPAGSELKRSGGTSSGVLPLMRVVNEVGRGVMSGGKRRSAIWAGLRWNHKDVFDFIKEKNWSDEIRKIKEKNFDFPASLDMTNIDKDNSYHKWATDVYWAVVEQMVTTAEPAFSVDYENKKESLRNA